MEDKIDLRIQPALKTLGAVMQFFSELPVPELTHVQFSDPKVTEVLQKGACVDLK